VILYLYALVSGLEAIDAPRGVGGEDVALLEVNGIRVASGWIRQPPAVSRETLHAQDQVVRALHAHAGAVLPFRFGTAARDFETAARSIEVIRPGLAERFALVGGRDQMTVRALGDAQAAESVRGSESAAAISDENESSAGPGARYLRARAATRELPAPLIRVLDAVRDLARATEVEPGRRGLIGTVYHLIDRGGGEEYRRRLAVLASEQPGLALRVSGPSPAYAFAMRRRTTPGPIS
jgi:hypothetical protein